MTIAGDLQTVRWALSYVGIRVDDCQPMYREAFKACERLEQHLTAQPNRATETALRVALKEIKWDLENRDWHCENCNRDYGIKETDVYSTICAALALSPDKQAIGEKDELKESLFSLFDTNKSGPLSAREQQNISLAIMPFLLSEREDVANLALLIARLDKTAKAAKAGGQYAAGQRAMRERAATVADKKFAWPASPKFIADAIRAIPIEQEEG